MTAGAATQFAVHTHAMCTPRNVHTPQCAHPRQLSTADDVVQMAMLQHPFIVPHVESWVTQGHTVNVVLGYCERGDLGTLLEKRKASGLAAQPNSMGRLLLDSWLLRSTLQHGQHPWHAALPTSGVAPWHLK